MLFTCEYKDFLITTPKDADIVYNDECVYAIYLEMIKHLGE